jgi:2-keto-4-pentenoate hydratase/2-oxohepta-3-ene-1,7-dioic acid hydratase in catechol pathway
MKLLSFTINQHDSFGILDGDRVIDLGIRMKSTSLTHLIQFGLLHKAQEQYVSKVSDYALRDIQFLKPLGDEGRFICVGRNYKGHLAEANMKLPDFPSMFIRLGSSVVAHQSSLVLPKVSQQFDFEGELALVIGKAGRHISRQDAFKHIIGYSIFMDGSIRDFQFGHSLTAGKNFQSTGSFGPYIVTADEVGDPSQLDLHTRLNGEEVQHTITDDLIFDIPYLIEYISSYTTLMPGDIIATGTPEGVGFVRTPPLWMRAGDVLEVEISSIGKLRNTVIAET